MKIPPHAQKVFSGIIFDVYQWEQELFDGSKTTFEGIKRPHSSLIIPITTDGKIILSKEEQPWVPPFLSLPVGRWETGENPLGSAKRELLEETWYHSNEWKPYKIFHPSGKIDWEIYAYIAKNCRKTHEPHLDAGEKIRTMFVSFDEFVKIATEDESFRVRDITLEVLKHRAKGTLNELRILLLGDEK